MQGKSQKKAENYPALLKATKRTVVFVAAWMVVVFAFFVAAQFRHFLNANMFFLTRIIGVTAIALLILLCFFLVQIIVFTVWYKNKKYLAAFGIFFSAAILAVAVLAVTLAIGYVSGGI